MTITPLLKVFKNSFTLKKKKKGTQSFDTDAGTLIEIEVTFKSHAKFQTA